MPHSASELPADTPFGGPPRTGDGLPEVPPAIARWVKTECGRAKYLDLAQRGGPWARLRRWWFVLIAALRDWQLPVVD